MLNEYECWLWPWPWVSWLIEIPWCNGHGENVLLDSMILCVINWFFLTKLQNEIASINDLACNLKPLLLQYILLIGYLTWIQDSRKEEPSVIAFLHFVLAAWSNWIELLVLNCRRAGCAGSTLPVVMTNDKANALTLDFCADELWESQGPPRAQSLRRGNPGKY